MICQVSSDALALDEPHLLKDSQVPGALIGADSDHSSYPTEVCKWVTKDEIVYLPSLPIS